MQLTHKIALVTGGTAGMGLVVAEALAAAGSKVVMCGRNAAAGAAAVERMSSGGRPAPMFIECDVTNERSVSRMFHRIEGEFGRLDCAFNNAGVTAPHGLLANTEVDAWKKVVDVNLIGIYLCMREELGLMSRGGGGSIVNNSSLAGVVAIPGQSAYVASKFAVCGLTQAAAIEYARGRDGSSAVRVNAIAAGPIAGGMNNEQSLAANPEHTARKIGVTAMKRFGLPEEVASAALWLLSDASSFVTGAIIPVDGGAAAGRF